MPNLVIGRNETPPGYLRPNDVVDMIEDEDSERVFAVFYEDSDDIGIVSSGDGAILVVSLTGKILIRKWTFNSAFREIQDSGGTLRVFDSQIDFFNHNY